MRKFNFVWICAIIGIICAGGLVGTGCLKSNHSSACTPMAVTADEPAILAYLAANNITGYVKHSSGLYYKIDSIGGGVSPNASSKVYVTYTGRFTDNTVFDSVLDASKTGWILGTLIKGWQIGLPLISKERPLSIFFIPSALGYGCTATGPIPANSVLVFDITLLAGRLSHFRLGHGSKRGRAEYHTKKSRSRKSADLIIFFPQAKIFLDASLLVSVLNKEYPLFTYAARIVSLSNHKGFEVVTSPVCMAIAFYFAEKKHRSSAKKKIQLLQEHIGIVPVTASCVEKALQNPRVRDLEDGIEYYSALESKCDCIITEDSGDFFFSSISVMSSQAFFERHVVKK